MLGREEEDVAAEEKAPPCAVCGKPKECGVWGVDVCYPCANRWNTEVGDQLFAEENSLGDLFATEAKRRTLVWAKARKAKAA